MLKTLAAFTVIPPAADVATEQQHEMIEQEQLIAVQAQQATDKIAPMMKGTDLLKPTKPREIKERNKAVLVVTKRKSLLSALF